MNLMQVYNLKVWELKYTMKKVYTDSEKLKICQLVFILMEQLLKDITFILIKVNNP